MKRALILVGAVAMAVAASKLLIENLLGISLEPTATRWIQQAGSGSALAIVTLLAIDIFLPVPSSVVMVLSGAAFGTVWGGLLSLVGSVGGEWLGFELVRRYGRRLSSRLVSDEEAARLGAVVDRHGVAAIVVTRALPIVMETLSVVAGLSGMRRSAFLIASLLGTAPIVFVYAYAGAVSRQTGSLVPAFVMLAAVAGAGWIWYRARIAPTLGVTASEHNQSNKWDSMTSRTAVASSTLPRATRSDEISTGPASRESVTRP